MLFFTSRKRSRTDGFTKDEFLGIEPRAQLTLGSHVDCREPKVRDDEDRNVDRRRAEHAELDGHLGHLPEANGIARAGRCENALVQRNRRGLQVKVRR